ncbi:MAG: cobyric acid synthase [Alphaproteobacteria bacterium]|nr:cobyric acid synthase [Alphaproteobacteria bacterium]
MLQGTGSDVGKSLLVAGFARAFTRRGLRVRPFKPQNMSNNAAVTLDGGEIGRAQALQARACGIAPRNDMNPVLLKPQAGVAQVVVHGRVIGQARARDYQAMKPTLLPRVLDSYGRLAADADLMLIEGAGSPAEINLRAGDIANMGFAEAADVPVVLVGDVDRGGVIASLIGTFELLSESERRRLKGYLINKFRGDVTLFDDAIEIIRARTGLDCLGVVPWFGGARALPAEDSMALERLPLASAKTGAIKIAVPRLPHIANFDDLDPLLAESGVALDVVSPGRALPADAALILLPGSKATRADLDALRAAGWDIDIRAHVRRGGRVLGLCGGYQMMGRRVVDPAGIEGPAGESPGLGLLDFDTVLDGDKTLRQSSGVHLASGRPVHGYEIHVGQTVGADCIKPMLRLTSQTGDRTDGATSEDGRIAGCYLHGLFQSDEFRAAFLAELGARADDLAFDASIESTLDDLAGHVAAAADLDRLLEIAHGS